MYELELYFGTKDPVTGETRDGAMTVTAIEANTITELTNLAYSEFKKQGAIGLSFGPAVPRNQFGYPV
jgi:hypothetical protein